MRKSIICFVAFLSFITTVKGQEILKENGSWFTFSNKISLSEKLYVSNVVQMRRVDFMKNVGATLFKPSFNYKLNNSVSFGIGYVAFKSHTNGVNPPAIKKGEERIWQHISINTSLGKTKLSNRFVFEERFKDVIDKSVQPNIIDGTSYAQRFRYRLLLSFNAFKLKNNKYMLAKVSNEIRVRFGTGVSQPDFDQNNFGAYLGYKINSHTKFWLGYGRDYYKSNSEKYISNNIFHLAMSYDINLIKK